MSKEENSDEIWYDLIVGFADEQRLIYCVADDTVAQGIMSDLRERPDPNSLGSGRAFLRIPIVDNRTVFFRRKCITYIGFRPESLDGIVVEYNDNFRYLDDGDGVLPHILFKFSDKSDIIEFDDLTGQTIPQYLNQINEGELGSAFIELKNKWGDTYFVNLANVLCIEVQNSFIKPLESEK